MKRILLALVILFAIAPVHAQDQETVEPALATAVSDQLATDFPLMTQTAAAALTPTVEGKTDGNINVDVNIEQPPAPEPPPVANPVDDVISRYGTLALAVIAVIAIYFVSQTGIVNAAAGMPKWAFDMGMFAADRGVAELERRAKLTVDDPADDMTVASLRRELDELKRQVEEVRIVANAAAPKVDSAP